MREADLIYLCGPKGMIHDIRSMVVNLGVEEGRVRTEHWD